MEQNNENLGYKVEYIPPNFKEGVSFMGYMFKVTNVLQAVPIVAVFVLLIFTVGAGLPFIGKLIAIIFLCGPVLVLAAVGINGDSMFGFLKSVIATNRDKGAYLYNPRVKKEIKSLEEDPVSVEMLPREKILGYIEKKRSGKDSAADYRVFSYDDMFFEEDEGFAEKPYEYMTAKERRAYRKQHRDYK